MLRRHKLTTTFALVSLLAMVALGAALVVALSALLKEQALEDGSRTAELFVRLQVDVNDDVTRMLNQQTPKGDELAALTASLAELSKRTKRTDQPQVLRAVRLWTTEGTLVWDSTQTGETGFPDTSRLDRVLANDANSAAVVDEVASDDSGTVDKGVNVSSLEQQRVLDVYVPIHTPGGEVTGIAEVVLDYSATQEALNRSTRLVMAIVGLGLALLWVLLFRTVWNASRTLRRQASETARLALLDPLTGLPNRRLLNERLERAATISARTGDPVGLILLDVDRFKEVNDTLGHPRGDALLVQVAERLKEAVRETDTVARLGGDEFAVLLPSTAGVEEAEMVARRVQSIFAQPFDLDGLTLHVDTSVGLAVLPNHADDVTSLMQRADVAMYTAKQSRSSPTVYAPAGDDHSPNRLVLLGDLRRALDNDTELSMHYQPKIDLETGHVCGLEALLRWHHPMRGFVPPVEFIPIAEQTGLVVRLTHKVLEMVLAQMSEWSAAGQQWPMAINLSSRNLGDDDLVGAVTRLLDHYGVDPSLIEFEITESAIVEDPERARTMLRELADRGMGVAIDDFGIGSTSMGQLRSLPLSTIKIDRSFVTDIVSDPADRTLVKAIVDLGHEFGLTVVAEGVENDDVLNRLKELGCDVGQGWHWSPAVPAAALPDLVASLEAQPAVSRR